MDESDERIILKYHGRVSDLVVEDFPDGDVYIRAIKAHGVTPHNEDSTYWTACARWALLKRFNLWDDIKEKDLNIEYTKEADTGKSVLHLSQEQRNMITRQWQESCQRAKSWRTLRSSSSPKRNDLLEFLETGMSNDRVLEFASLEIRPGYNLHTHSHPNLELAYCAQGSLHEVRISNTNVPQPSSSQTPYAPSLDMESMTTESLRQGEWLVNAVGSIHKSFTCPKEGCLLILLFSGSETEIDEGKHMERLQRAMKIIDPAMTESSVTN